MTFEAMWRDLVPVGRSATSGGYRRSPWTSLEAELRAWFAEAALARGLEVETDAIGNQVAWWRPTTPTELPAVLTGSHLDSVHDGGAFDGPLGVVSALAAVDVLRDRGFEPTRGIGVSVFTEEEGSRFGLACLGSRLVTGATTWEAVRRRQDRDGIYLDDAVSAAGLDPTGDLMSLSDVGCFVELHVEQGRDLVDRDVAVGVASEIWPHGRYRFDFTGEANHAGTTRMEDRRDPMLTYAMTALAANKQARLCDQRATFGRLEVTPNGTNAVPSHVTAWLDARCSDDASLADLVETITRQSHDRASRDGTALTVTAESVSSSVTFDPDLARSLAALGDWPVIATQAGHDAGILSAAGIATAMLFVRNPTGVSHSPDEHAETVDCLVGVEALADTLTMLAS
ncbi:MAG: allantoate amidohydrolase [Nocardioides sp.]|jgi:N-carbamoyl-L-amino-acid hydrolase|uniref:allantoate amidohydrolase n=1 Tax=Nocardioides sp. TaxID=35761 RepID=UPI00261DC044|nr:allantoate amidohydrolase [Nocardioides sp.]MCW2833830.1 allantoate amidohydrolase [Nocardioides sp.]